MDRSQKSSHKKARQWLFKHALAARTWLLLSVALGFGSGLLLVVQARFLARIVHGAFIDGRGTDVLWPLFAILAVVISLRAILGWAREVSGFYAGARIRQDIRTEILKHLVALGPGYTNRQSSAALASTAHEHVEGLHDFYAFYLPQLALAVMIPTAIVAFIF
ncbi:MAG: ABC transporter transmembrane domain-containing protein, partial [Desulfobacterales bacterium]